MRRQRLCLGLACLVVATSLGGCLHGTPPAGPTGDRLEIRTRYVPEYTDPGNRSHGLAPGAAAANGTVSISYSPGWSGGNRRIGPDTDLGPRCEQSGRAVTDGAKLFNGTCSYQVDLGPNGQAVVWLPQSPPRYDPNVTEYWAVQLSLHGPTPDQPEGCEGRSYRSHNESAVGKENIRPIHVRTRVRNDTVVEVPFKIECPAPARG